jgi:16S rRNA (guanine1207-N2)-methyltransferase
MSDHYFSTAPPGPERRRLITAKLWSREVSLITAAGIFSPEGLDRGTAILLRESPVPQGKLRLLDLGCGYGPIAIALALHCPEATIDAVDVNERALMLCRENAAALGVADRVNACRPEQINPEIRYDEIWSNPPIRIGKEALHTLLHTWLARLEPAGIARLVVAKNLGADTLQNWLNASGYQCIRTGSSKGFRVLQIKIAR